MENEGRGGVVVRTPQLHCSPHGGSSINDLPWHRKGGGVGRVAAVAGALHHLLMMKPLIAIGCLALLGLGGVGVEKATAQGGEVARNGKTVEWLVASAVLAAPASLRDGAEVRGWTDDDRLVTLRVGTNSLICLTDRPGDGEFAAACYHQGLEPFMERGRELLREGVRGMERQEVRWQEIEAGELPMPDRGMVYNISYDTEDFDPAALDPATTMRLHALYIRGATTESTGVATEPGDGPWLMFAGTPSAHIMIGIPPTVPGTGSP